jgi:hypothetical protein
MIIFLCYFDRVMLVLDAIFNEIKLKFFLLQKKLCRNYHHEIIFGRKKYLILFGLIN